MKRWFALGLGLIAANAVADEITLDLETAIERAQQGDHRVAEKRFKVEAAKGQVQEAEGAKDLIFDVTAALAATTRVEGGFFNEGEQVSNASVRDDLYDVDGFSPFVSLQLAIIKPLYTFGKVAGYKRAAEGFVKVQEGEVAKQRASTALEVSRAYFGFLAARDGAYLLEEAKERLEGATAIANEMIESGEGNIKQSNLYALDSGIKLIEKFLAQTTALRTIAHKGLALLTGVPAEQLKVADRRLRPLPLPENTLEEFIAQALSDRAEIKQVEGGLEARKGLLEAKQAESLPNLFAGVVGSAAWSPNRDTLDNPHIVDPFNHYAASPVLGLQWHWESGRQKGQVAQAEAELNAIMQTEAFAQKGIPFEVTEAFHTMHGLYEGQQALNEGSRASRRWMLASYLDLEAGIEEPAEVIDALKSYVLTYSDYLITLNDYNLSVMKLKQTTGELQ